MNKQDNLGKLIDENSFKIKPIVIELPNYSYYHSAISNKNKDCNSRFIGRKNLIKKIRSFVYETTMNTGTYLVSGFRGMGKTSLVNKALANLNPAPKSKIFFLFWFLLLPTIFLKEKVGILKDVFTHDSEKIVYCVFTLVIFLICYIFLIYHQGSRLFNVNEHTKWYAKVYSKNFLLDVLFPQLQREKYIFTRVYLFFFKYVISFALLLFLQEYFSQVSNPYFHNFWLLNIYMIFCYLLFLIIDENVFIFFKSIKEWLVLFILVIILEVFFLYFTLHWFLTAVFVILLILVVRKQINLVDKKNIKYETVLSRLFSFLNFQQYLVVKINLGKDKLTEKDVLKYITNEIYNLYSKWYFNFISFKRFVNGFTLILLLLTALNGLYGLIDKENSYELVNIKFNLSKYFPSQSLLKFKSYSQKDKKNTTYQIEVERLNLKELYSNDIVKYKSIIKDRLPNEFRDIIHAIGYKSIKKVTLDTVFILDKENGIILNKRNEKARLKIIKTQSLFNKISVRVGKITNTLDYLFFTAYLSFKKVVFGEYRKNTIVQLFFPRTPPLLVFATLLFILILYRFLPLKLIPFKSHLSEVRELKNLKNQIDASITKENNANSAIGGSSFFNFKKSSTYKPLESKDISQKLIHILDEISKIKPLFSKMNFILVFDELDKISSHYNEAISNKEDEYNIKDEIRFQARRKERIFMILSSMKHFLNTAKIKSIFIAGREMYDAALAGISDRESNLDSIFNDNKIYVNSFYTEGDDNNLTDITSMTDYYISQFLIPEYYVTKFNLKHKLTSNPEKPSIRMYNGYLKEEFKGRDKERIKTIATLKDFVKYLTYRSNGAPRKISNLFEQYLQSYTSQDLSREDQIVFAKNNQSLCLRLGYYDQYKFSFISYLVTPIFLSLGNYMVEYSDKLLVSISYMLDHILKHHKFGLSYRSLSLTPEIIDVNKEPEFRNFLNKLIGFLSKSHLRKIVSGIYDYKFNSKITSELKFLSKIDELEAAAFNFTLDESIELKRHFRKKIKYLEEKNNTKNISLGNFDNKEYKHSISLIYMHLGDLHFNDEEFGDAVEHYLEAIQIIRQKNIHQMFVYDFIVYVRNKLKLGLAFEKNNNFDSAQMTYSELTDLILKKRNISVQKLGLCRFYLQKDNIYNFINTFDNKKIKKVLTSKIGSELNASLKTEIENIYFGESNYTNEIIVIGRPLKAILRTLNSDDEWKKVRHITEMETFYDFDAEYISKNFSDLSINLKPIKRNFDFTSFENIRILYQPIIAKLHLIEKSSPNKLKDVDLVRAIEEFKFFKRPLKTAQKRVIVAEFYNKLGDLLYFKNGTINSCLKKKLVEDVRGSKNKYNQDNIKKLLSSPIDATVFYTKSLAILLLSNKKYCKGKNNEQDDFKKINLVDYYTNIEWENTNTHPFFFNVCLTIKEIVKELDQLYKDEMYQSTYSTDYLSSIANGLIDLAGSLLSFTDGSLFFTCTDSCKAENQTQNLTLCLRLFYQANLIFKRLGEHRFAKSQLIKILHILFEKDSSSEILLAEIIPNGKDEGKGKEELTVDSIVNTCIKYIYRSYSQSTRPEIKKVRNLLDIEEGVNDTFQVYANTTIMAEINEVIYLYWILYFKMVKNGEDHEKNMFEEITDLNNDKLVEEVIQFSLKNTTPFSTVSNKYNRVLELSLRLKVNKYMFENETYYSDGHKVLNPKKDNKHFIIVDSIGICNEIIKTHNLFDINYVTTNNLVLAKAHYLMGYWCQKLDGIKLDEFIDEFIDDYKEYCKDNVEKIKKSYLSKYRSEWSQEKDDEISFSKKMFSKNKDIEYKTFCTNRVNVYNNVLENVKKILNSNSVMYLSPNYHFDLSLQYNYRVNEFHKRGNSLQEFLHNASYLDDFYNDNAIHFSISVERNFLNHGEFEKYLNKIKNLTVNSRVNNFKKYFDEK